MKLVRLTEAPLIFVPVQEATQAGQVKALLVIREREDEKLQLAPNQHVPVNDGKKQQRNRRKN